ncbi:MAG: AI-2E family transporter [Dethiobacter sp.]|jgi:predicted PurR-regulated permease PerM|nr:AI-2E family transporter [Dethiobacter sp.]MBS3983869.1 AI-2E family transporter [Dethiobacter sp.]
MEGQSKYQHAHLRHGRSLIIGVLVLLLFFLLYQTGDKLLVVLLPFFLAVIAAYILNPLVDFLEKHRIPRYLGILLIYAVFFSLFLAIGLSTIPVLILELQILAEGIPEYTRHVRQFMLNIQADYRRINIPDGVREVLNQNITELQNWLLHLVELVSHRIVALFSHTFMIFVIPILVYYILRDMELLKRSVLLVFPMQYRKWVVAMGSEMDRTMGAYFRGMLLTCFLVAAMTYTGLLIIGMEFALLLGIISGITNIIPYFGPFIGAVPAVLIALLSSPLLALKVIAVVIIVQQIESQLITPQVIGRSIGLHPLTVIFALILGGTLFGVAGLIFAVPLTAMLRIFIKYALELAAKSQKL